MWGVVMDYCVQGDDGIVVGCFGDLFNCQWYFVGIGDMDNCDVVFGNVVMMQSVYCVFNQVFNNKIVELVDYQCIVVIVLGKIIFNYFDICYEWFFYGL